MTMLALGLLFGVVTLLVMFSGMPIAFALGAVAVLFMAFFMPGVVARHGHAERLRGDGQHHAAVDPAVHPQGRGDRPVARRPAISTPRMHVWMQRVPGGLGIANVFACALFAAMAGSSPATCSAIGSAGIPEMRRRGYSPGFAAGIIAAGGTLGHPAAAVDHDDPVRGRGRAVAGAPVPRGHRAGRAAGGPLRRSTRCCSYRKEHRRAKRAFDARRHVRRPMLDDEHFTLREKFEMLPRVLPFVVLLIGVMVALYGGYATPSETAGLGAVLALVLIAVDLRRLARPRTWRRSWRRRSRSRRC